MTTLRARPEPLDLDLAATALVIVDMQNGFASKGGLFDLAGFDISRAPAVIEVNRRLLAAARRAGLKVVHLQMTFKPDLSDAGGPS
jgi:ureidoacrylate peracid hydrolase